MSRPDSHSGTTESPTVEKGLEEQWAESLSQGRKLGVGQTPDQGLQEGEEGRVTGRGGPIF